MIDDAAAVEAVRTKIWYPTHRRYVNLTRGALCPHLRNDSWSGSADYRYVRIPSTWCEQKEWDRILTTLGADFLMDLAQGVQVSVHDFSERPRETRAMWQGLEWIRYALIRTWYPSDESRVAWTSRSGMTVASYWNAQYLRLNRNTVGMLEYYGNFTTGDGVNLRSCY